MKPEDQTFPGQTTDGLTIRDYIAIQAMNGNLSNPEYSSRLQKLNPNKITANVVSHAYELADAMIAQSNYPQPPHDPK